MSLRGELTERQGRCRCRPRRVRRASHDDRGARRTRRTRSMKALPKYRRRLPISASVSVARISRWSPRSGRSFPATSNILRGEDLVSTTQFRGASELPQFRARETRRQSLGRGSDPARDDRGRALFLQFPSRRSRQLYGDRTLRLRARPSSSISCLRRRANSGRESSSSTRTAAPSCSSARSAAVTTCSGPDSPSGLNPLQLPDTPANRQFLIDWLGSPRRRRRRRGGRAHQGSGRRQLRAAA